MVASRYLISNGQFIYFEGKKQSRDNPQKAAEKKKGGVKKIYTWEIQELQRKTS